MASLTSWEELLRQSVSYGLDGWLHGHAFVGVLHERVQDLLALALCEIEQPQSVPFLWRQVVYEFAQVSGRFGVLEGEFVLLAGAS